jgi:3-methyl-2-oxobutanoate hydroxymethyltransferase
VVKNIFINAMNQSVEKAECIRACKGRRHVTLVTAYDYPTGRLLDEAGVDVVLVGDSVGMVQLGFPDTTHVTLDHMVHHVEATARGVKNALLVGDMPIHTYDTVEDAVRTAGKLFRAGADAVKLEGGAAQAEKICAIVKAGIPVMGHIGLLPQKVLEEGGYRIKGKSAAEADALVKDVQAVAEAGACSVVVEGVTPSVARRITAHSPIPTLGIGSGAHTCDGDVVVIHDLVGAFPWFVPAFVKPRADVAGSMTAAVKEWMKDVYTEPGTAGS